MNQWKLIKEEYPELFIDIYVCPVRFEYVYHGITTDSDWFMSKNTAVKLSDPIIGGCEMHHFRWWRYFTLKKPEIPSIEFFNELYISEGVRI
jgi:hypothetical protein